MKKEIKNIIKTTPLPKAHSAEKHAIPITTEIGCCIAFLLMALGFVCVFYTDHFYEKLPFLLGELMIGLGTVDIVRGFHTGEYKKRETKLTSNGIVYVLLGIVILHFKSEAFMLIGAIWGTLGLFKGSEELNKAICSITEKKSFVKELLSAVIELVLGILLLLEPDGSLHHHILILGIELMVTGWQYICRTIKTRNT